MSLLHRHPLDEAPPVELPRDDVPATTRRPLRIDEPARAVDVLFGLQLEGGTFDTAPLELADWSARLAADFGHVNSALGWLASNTQRCIEQGAYTEYFAAEGLYQTCVALTDDLAPFAAKAGA